MKNLLIKSLACLSIILGLISCSDSGSCTLNCSANVTVQSITLLPLQASGNGSAAPNQWLVAQNTVDQTMIVTYSNIGTSNAATNFAANNLSPHPSSQESSEMKNLIGHYLSDAHAISSSIGVH